ncbi:MAG: hypothetical protein J6V93_01910, partial [Clostridia bacterium]|nr:hypothetical protein [Clostridia bacterium]
ADGIRIRKNGTNYTLDGSNIIREYDANGKDIYFNYDLDGVCGFRIGDTDYFYRKNLQGDITDIYHEDGTKYASYTYDAWGNCTITLDTNGIGTLNPFRYRGYYYDSETNLYYLKSRYYDPATGRFINADELIDKSKILGFNLYGYCQNNPIMLVDDDGNLAYPGEIHNRVVAHLAATHGLIPEQKILYENGHGRADLMNASGYIWEVKPNNERNIKKGRKQLEKYVSGKWSFNEATKLSYGYELPSGSFFYSPNSMTSYIVTYHYLDNGLIVYDYKENINWDLVEQGAKATAGAAATLIILFVSTAVLKYPIVV